MNTKKEFQNNSNTSDETLKLTSLIYFKEALFNEEYEKCAELVRIAKRFGARSDEIRGVIAESNKGIRPAPLTGSKKPMGRRMVF